MGQVSSRGRRLTWLKDQLTTDGLPWRFPGRVPALLERREERELERFHKQLEWLELLVLDELGYVPFTKAGAELLFDVVGRAYERTSLMVTTNLPFEAWTEIMGSERLTGALLDRLTHRVHIMADRGRSAGERAQLPPGRGRAPAQGTEAPGAHQQLTATAPHLRQPTGGRAPPASGHGPQHQRPPYGGHSNG